MATYKILVNGKDKTDLFKSGAETLVKAVLTSSPKAASWADAITGLDAGLITALMNEKNAGTTVEIFVDDKPRTNGLTFAKIGWNLNIASQYAEYKYDILSVEGKKEKAVEDTSPLDVDAILA